MGLTKFIKNKVNDYKAERAHQHEERLASRDQYEKGYREGSYKRGLAEGEGKLTQREAFYAKHGSTKTQGVTGRIGAMGDAAGRAAKHSDGIFGWSGGGGLDFGLGGGETKRPAAARPSRVTTVDPRTGKVRTEHYDAPRPEHQESGGLLDDPWGMGPAQGKKDKKEKHFLDPF